ncbi:MAG: SHOCT domain-containing protein [Gammaproteobacteria bacterium]|jgi:hypothetical protein
MGNKALQQLAHEYAVGVITRYEYRKRRQVLIDEATGYHVPCDLHCNPHDQQNPPTDLPGSKRYKVMILAVIVAAIVIAIMYTGYDPRKDRSQSGFYQTLSNGTKST